MVVILIILNKYKLNFRSQKFDLKKTNTLTKFI